jgi:hypothetical protein
MRRAIDRHGITADELVTELRRQRLCAGREAEMVEQLIRGGRCVVGVAVAVIALIVRQKGATRH